MAGVQKVANSYIL